MPEGDAVDQLSIDGTENIEVLDISKTEAQEFTDNIKEMADELWHMLLEAYERGVHKALGYKSWGAYYEAEFGQSGKRGDQLLRAGRVVRAIEEYSQDTNVSSPNEAQARELAPLAKKDPQAAAEVWHEAVEEYGEDVAAADVRQTMEKKAEEETSVIWSAKERELAEQLLQGGTVVVNMHSGVHPRLIKWAKENGKFVKVDRRSEWGNPFEVPADGKRETVIRNYGQHYLPYKPSLLDRLGELRGKALGCWCAPEPCHGDVLKAKAE